MPLRIIYGKSGTGKSNFIYNEINEKIKHNEKNKIYIITPEQFSFTAEKKLMENKKSVINAEVITFNRMAYRVMNEIGGNIHNNLTKCGKSMLIYSILQKEKKNLNLLNKSDENIDLAMRTISEFKKNQVSIDELKKETENINDNYLKIKLQDLILIYEKFNNNIENKYIDETDLLTKLSENIEKINLFKNSIFYIDEFVGYTKQELEIIKKLLNISKNVTITFCIDNLDFNSNPDTDIFYPNKTTLNIIESCPALKSGFFLTIQTVAISIPPQQPLLRSAKPTPIPQIIAAKATFNKASSTIGSLITGRIDSNTV